ncbi:MAG: hypothetical protein OES09_02795 [Gammaproteobacteria bacterium]|nr:hypothetical protein [Gammaproteobacteria bacterium]
MRKRTISHTYPRAFTVRSRGLPKTMFRVRKASKRRLRASVYDRFKYQWLAVQAEGGRKTPHSSSEFAVPNKLRRTAGGKIPKRYRNAPRTFVADLGRGYGRAIWQRPAQRHRRLKLLFMLEQGVDVPKRFRFYQDARRVIATRWPRNIKESWRRALATAR